VGGKTGILATIINRMLKKPASFVLDSSKSSTYRLRFSERERAGGVFPFAKNHRMGERPHEVWSVPPPVSMRLRPCLGKGASWRARVGRVRCLAYLSILRGVSLLFPDIQTNSRVSKDSSIEHSTLHVEHYGHE